MDRIYGGSMGCQAGSIGAFWRSQVGGMGPERRLPSLSFVSLLYLGETWRSSMQVRPNLTHTCCDSLRGRTQYLGRNCQTADTRI